MTTVMYIVHESSASWLVVASHTVLMVHCRVMNCPPRWFWAVSQHIKTLRQQKHCGLMGHYNTFTPEAKPRPGLSQHIYTEAWAMSQHIKFYSDKNSEAWAVSQHIKFYSDKNIEAWAVSQHIKFYSNKNIEAWALSQHIYSGKNTEASQHIYTGKNTDACNGLCRSTSTLARTPRLGLSQYSYSGKNSEDISVAVRCLGMWGLSLAMIKLPA